MKPIKYLLTLAAVMGALTVSAKADLNFLGAISFFDNKPNSPAANLVALGNFGVDTTGLGLCGNFESLSGDQTITVEVGESLVAHSDKGSGGSPKGGIL